MLGKPFNNLIFKSAEYFPFRCFQKGLYLLKSLKIHGDAGLLKIPCMLNVI